MNIVRVCIGKLSAFKLSLCPSCFHTEVRYEPSPVIFHFPVSASVCNLRIPYCNDKN